MLPKYISSLLHRCSKTRALQQGFSLHAAVLKMGMNGDVIVSNHVLNMYAKCGSLTSAHALFDEMSERNLVSWSAMISGYHQAGEHLLALDLFSDMHLVPNEYIFASAISACASFRSVVKGRQVHAHSLKFGYASISFVCNSLISMYMKCRCSSDASLVFGDAFEPNSVTYNALIAGFVENQLPDKGFDVFKLMLGQGLLPDRFTFAGALEICSSLNDLRRGVIVHCLSVKLNLESNPLVGNMMMTVYSKFSLIEEAEKVFRLIEAKDVISWNSLMAACSHGLDHEKGLRVLKEMLTDHDVRPDDFTFATALAASAGLAWIRHGKQIHARLIRTMLNQDVGVGNALVNMYAKCGLISYSYKVYNNMHHRNIISWNTIIAACANHGLGRSALKVFEQMKATGIKPDSVTFTGLLTACSHAGLVKEGEEYFKSMEKNYGISPDIEHITCLVDLLGRAGKLHEAEECMNSFSFRQDPIVLGTLVSACRVHGDVVMGERLAKQLVDVQAVSTSASPYVLLSNMYASDAMWEHVAEARKILKEKGLKKEPGYSLIEVQGTFENSSVSHSRLENNNGGWWCRVHLQLDLLI